MLHRRAKFFAIALLPAAIVLTGCTGRIETSDTIRPGTWSSLLCTTCERNRIAVDVQLSVSEGGRSGSHLLARVSNLNAHAVALVVDFRSDDPADADGYVPGDVRGFTLGPVGTPNASMIVMLRRTDIAKATVGRVERVSSDDASSAVRN